MEKYIISIDAGTTSCRVLLVDMEGQYEVVSQLENTQIFPNAGWVEHDPIEIRDHVKSMLADLALREDLSMEQIVSIGITNQRETVVVWDANTGLPIYNAIVWQDKRTATYAQSLRDTDLGDYIQDHTGLIPDAYFSGTKIRWILEHNPEWRQKADRGELLCGTIDTWLIWSLTEEQKHLTDHTNASRTMLYNIKELCWDDKIIEHMEIPAEMLPQVQSSMGEYGHIKLGEYLVPVHGVAGDQQSALFGQLCWEPGMAKNTYGTGCFMLMHVGDEFVASPNGLLTTLACSTNDKAEYALEGSVFVAGAAIQWLRDGLKIIVDSADTERIAETTQEDDVVVVPAFVGLGAPYWDMSARGAIFGISHGVNQEQLIKATLHSLAYQTYDVLGAMEQDGGVKLQSLNVDGGACANNYLMQFQADILDVAVDRPKWIETTALGAAYLAGLQSGVWTTESLSEMRQTDRVFTPEIEEETRKSKISRWQDAVSRTRNWIK